MPNWLRQSFWQWRARLCVCVCVVTSQLPWNCHTLSFSFQFTALFIVVRWWGVQYLIHFCLGKIIIICVYFLFTRDSQGPQVRIQGLELTGQFGSIAEIWNTHLNHYCRLPRSKAVWCGLYVYLPPEAVGFQWWMLFDPCELPLPRWDIRNLSLLPEVPAISKEGRVLLTVMYEWRVISIIPSPAVILLN